MVINFFILKIKINVLLGPFGNGTKSGGDSNSLNSDINHYINQGGTMNNEAWKKLASSSFLFTFTVALLLF
jgi:hypothetical protein